MSKPTVNQEICIGCSTCASLCPEVFKMNDENKAEVIEEVDYKNVCIDEAVNSCPVQAISVE